MKSLSKNQIRSLSRERKALLKELSSSTLLIRGTFFSRYSTCSRPSCACHRGKRHGPRTYVAVTSRKAQRQHYVPLSQLKSVRTGVEQYRRLLRIIDRLTVINLTLMKGGSLNDKL